MILEANGEGQDQTARMRSLIWAFAVRIFAQADPGLVVRICPEATMFLRHGPNKSVLHRFFTLYGLLFTLYDRVNMHSELCVTKYI